MRPVRGDYPCKMCPRVLGSPGALGGHMTQHRLGRAVAAVPVDRHSVIAEERAKLAAFLKRLTYREYWSFMVLGYDSDAEANLHAMVDYDPLTIRVLVRYRMIGSTGRSVGRLNFDWHTDVTDPWLDGDTAKVSELIAIIIGQMESHERFEDLRFDGVPVIDPHPHGPGDIRVHL